MCCLSKEEAENIGEGCCKCIHLIYACMFMCVERLQTATSGGLLCLHDRLLCLQDNLNSSCGRLYNLFREYKCVRSNNIRSRSAEF